MNKEHARRVLDFFSVQRVPLSNVLERYGILSELNRVGKDFVGCCPIHKGSNPRQFVVSPHKGSGLWKCFGDCKRGGATLEFVAAMENTDIPHAAQLIARWFAIAPSGTSFNQRSKRRKSMSEVSKQPTHKVYSAQKREGKKDFMTRIGSAWPFEFPDKKTGKTRSGLNIQLSAMPIGDRMVLFEYDAEEEETYDNKKERNGRKK